MAISESQLDTWSGVGSVTQSAQTYDSIQRVLNDSTSPYYAVDFSIFLQGSYGNRTNVYSDSDVDIVIRLNQTYFADINLLTPDAKANYNEAFRRATYAFADFKADVVAWLQKKFGADVRSGDKAIFIKGNGSRRDADVLVCAVHRRYRASSDGVDYQHDDGIVFWTDKGIEIVNFPQQHSENCSTKHQNTNQRFKPMVRVFKNMRNRMVDDRYILDGVAPSYFIEGLLWNVPGDRFGAGYGASFVNAFNWVLNADNTKLTCANELYWLVRDNAHACWPSTNCDTYLAAVRRYWDDWSA